MTKAASYIELHVDNFQKVLDFYGTLGFSLVWAEEDYLTMSLGDAVVCFYGGSEIISSHTYFGKFPHDTKRGFGVELVFFVDDIEVMQERAKRLGSVVAELQQRSWGVRDFRLEDPFGYYLRLSEPYEFLNREDKISETNEVLSRAGLNANVAATKG